LARALRASGLSILLPEEVGTKSAEDPGHLERATQLGACLVTKNIGDFVTLHGAWVERQLPHAGILVSEDLAIGLWVDRLGRAGRVLTPEIAAGSLLYLNSFATDDEASAMVISLGGSP